MCSCISQSSSVEVKGHGTFVCWGIWWPHIAFVNTLLTLSGLIQQLSVWEIKWDKQLWKSFLHYSLLQWLKCGKTMEVDFSEADDGPSSVANNWGLMVFLYDAEELSLVYSHHTCVLFCFLMILIHFINSCTTNPHFFKESKAYQYCSINTHFLYVVDNTEYANVGRVLKS